MKRSFQPLLIALTVLIGALAQARAQAQAVETGIVKLGDANIEYFSQGRGEAFVLLPGGSFDVG